jgi:hypothetical protein
MVEKGIITLVFEKRNQAIVVLDEEMNRELPLIKKSTIV